MSNLTMTSKDLRRILMEVAGTDTGTGSGSELADDFLDTGFDLLGYDSLALIETSARIKQEFEVEIADHEITDLDTPRALLARVNEASDVSETSA